MIVDAIKQGYYNSNSVVVMATLSRCKRDNPPRRNGLDHGQPTSTIGSLNCIAFKTSSTGRLMGMCCLRYHLALLTLLLLPSLAAANVVISEVLADPPAGPAGDANRDGQPDPHEDEFIEPAGFSRGRWGLTDSSMCQINNPLCSKKSS